MHFLTLPYFLYALSESFEVQSAEQVDEHTDGTDSLSCFIKLRLKPYKFTESNFINTFLQVALIYEYFLIRTFSRCIRLQFKASIHILITKLQHRVRQYKLWHNLRHQILQIKSNNRIKENIVLLLFGELEITSYKLVKMVAAYPDAFKHQFQQRFNGFV